MEKKNCTVGARFRGKRTFYGYIITVTVIVDIRVTCKPKASITLCTISIRRSGSFLNAGNIRRNGIATYS